MLNTEQAASRIYANQVFFWPWKTLFVNSCSNTPPVVAGVGGGGGAAPAV